MGRLLGCNAAILCNVLLHCDFWVQFSWLAPCFFQGPPRLSRTAGIGQCMTVPCRYCHGFPSALPGQCWPMWVGCTGPYGHVVHALPGSGACSLMAGSRDPMPCGLTWRSSVFPPSRRQKTGPSARGFDPLALAGLASIWALRTS